MTKPIYKMHEKLGGFDFIKKLKKEGKVNKIGFSFHDTAEELEKILTKHPEFDFVYLQINYLDWDSEIIQSEKCYEIAKKYGKEIIVMEPIKGGALSSKYYAQKQIGLTVDELAELALNFVASLDGVDIILSGMNEVQHIINNRKTLLNKNIKYEISKIELIKNIIRKENKIQCTQCEYCVRECPKNISIPEVISILNAAEHTGDADESYVSRTRLIYERLGVDKGLPSECIKCGKCEKACPQKIAIREHMEEAANLFESNCEWHFKKNCYTDERNVQILIYLLKAHGIKKIVISPGSANVAFSYSVQYDGDFEIYSCVDERSAAYMACGLAAETGEVVVLNCTGATASRNYLPALTEAYYRKLPILAITATQYIGNIGNLIPQVIDRSVQQNDIAKLSVDIPIVNTELEEWSVETKLNKAILEVNRKNGCGPVHINLQTSWTKNFPIKRLPKARVIKRFTCKDNFPEIKKGNIGIFVGAHTKWSDKLQKDVDEFCERYNAVVLCDQTSNYKGERGVLASIIVNNNYSINKFNLIIHIGEVSGAYIPLNTENVWRVNPDGEVRDPFKKLSIIFEMSEEEFFERYINENIEKNIEFSEKWKSEYKRLVNEIPELPFSNAWVAQKMAPCIPENSVIHFGILNSLRCWNFFEINKTTLGFCNTGGFGIDGCVSSLIGASLANPNKLYFGVVGDLAFFYDMNVLGNRHIQSNLRLMIINNGIGKEMKLKRAGGFLEIFGDEVDTVIAAKGHFGNQSNTLVKNYAMDLGFEYLSASNKEEFFDVIKRFTFHQITELPMVLEIFIDEKEESPAIDMIENLEEKEEKILYKNNKIVVHPQIKHSKAKWNVILWGSGMVFQEYIKKIEERCKIEYVCDNNQQKWGQEIYEGVKCISPESLKQIKNPFVVIMIENIGAAFEIGNQLLEMGISSFDTVYNFLKYENGDDFI